MSCVVAYAWIFEKCDWLMWPACHQVMPFAVSLKRYLLYCLKGHVPLNIIFFPNFTFSACCQALCLSVAVLSAFYPVSAVAEWRKAASSGL